MKKRPKPEKHKQLKVEPKVHRDRLRPSRVCRVYPDPDAPFVVEVRISKHRRAMRDEINFHEGEEFAKTVSRDCMGLVRSWWGPRTRRLGVLRARRIVARVFLNVKDLRARPSEIVAHECGHAAMAWARIQRANLNHMAGEEVMCYAVGHLVRQVNYFCFAYKVW